mgnify:CR=1 FL=1
MTQERQSEWHDQWSMLSDDEEFLFRDWIHPMRIEDLRGLSVLECGCGGGHHTAMLADHAARVTAVDLNTVDLARARNGRRTNVEFLEADVASMDLGREFDVVVGVGMVHHTDDPDRTFENLRRHTRVGGRTIVWVYSREGNWMVERLVEPFLGRFARVNCAAHCSRLFHDRVPSLGRGNFCFASSPKNLGPDHFVPVIARAT